MPNLFPLIWVIGAIVPLTAVVSSPPPVTEVWLGVQAPIFKVDTSYDGGGHDRFTAALIAIEEINDKAS